MNTIYLGEWGGVSVYQSEYEYRESVGLPSRVYKCTDCKIRWFRAITNFYAGLCYYCWLEQFEGEEEMVL